MQEEYFPVSLDSMGANIEFLHFPEDQLHVEGASVRVIKHNHPGGVYSYRLQDIEGKVMVFCTDIEHGDDIDQRIIELARDADLLIHDGQYTPEELSRFKGWGHSSWEQAVEVAKQANVKQLVITHHDPDHNDDFLRDIEKQVQAQFPNAMLAREKMEIII